MARDPEKAAQGGAALSVAMARLDLRATDLATVTDGRVSVASIRAYTRGETMPTKRNAYALASALDPEGGRAVLDAWGLTALAETIEDEPHETVDAGYVMERDSSRPEHIEVGHEFTAVVTSIIETANGTRWIVQTNSGTLLEAVPILSVSVDPTRARLYD